jgi:hypothetical protein
VNKHSNLYAYKYLEGMQKKEGGESLTLVSFNDVKEYVFQDFDRMGAFNSKEFIDLVDFEIDPNSKRTINYTKFTRLDNINGEQWSGFFVPVGITTEDLIQAFECRYQGRFPTLSYVHKKSGNQIWRSSELRPKKVDSEAQQSDVKIIKALI